MAPYRGDTAAVMDDGRVGRGENPLEFGQRAGGGGGGGLVRRLVSPDMVSPRRVS